MSKGLESDVRSEIPFASQETRDKSLPLWPSSSSPVPLREPCLRGVHVLELHLNTQHQINTCWYPSLPHLTGIRFVRNMTWELMVSASPRLKCEQQLRRSVWATRAHYCTEYHARTVLWASEQFMFYLWWNMTTRLHSKFTVVIYYFFCNKIHKA